MREPLNSIDGPAGAEAHDSTLTRDSAGDAASLLIRMEQVPFSRWHANARIVMGSATFFDAFNALSLAFALPTLIRLWHISPEQIGLLISASYVGQLAGALVFSALAEKVGRIRGTTAAVAIMSVMSFGCAMAGNFPALFACRFVQGIGVGGEMPVAATYINELSPRTWARKIFPVVRDDISRRTYGHRTDRRVARAGVWMEFHISAGGNSRIAHHFSGRAASRIAEMVDLQGPLPGSGSDGREN